MLGDPSPTCRWRSEVDYFRLSRDRYFIPVSVKIPGSAIALARKGANETTEFDFIGQVRDAKGKLVANVRDGIKVKLNEANAAQLASGSFQYDTGFTLPPAITGSSSWRARTRPARWERSRPRSRFRIC